MEPYLEDQQIITDLLNRMAKVYGFKIITVGLDLEKDNLQCSFNGLKFSGDERKLFAQCSVNKENN